MGYGADDDNSTRVRVMVQQDDAMVIVAALVVDGLWFVVTPFPNDRWEITVEAEAGAQLLAIARRTRLAREWHLSNG